MDTHVRNLGRLNIAFGLIGGIAALASLVAAGGIAGIYRYFDAPMAGAIVSFLVVLQLLTSLPSVLAGFFVIRYHNWARALLIVTSALNALNPPVGTVLGAYGLWVLLSQEIEPLFEGAPSQPSPNRGRPPGRKLERSSTESIAPPKTDLKRAAGLD
jgi:hypothetical protein